MLTQDILARLSQRQEELAELFLTESDPATFPGLDTKEGRGDTLWLKKNAGQTLNLVCRIESLLEPTKPSDDPDDFDAEKAEREALAEAEAILATTARNAKAVVDVAKKVAKKKR